MSWRTYTVGDVYYLVYLPDSFDRQKAIVDALYDLYTAGKIDEAHVLVTLLDGHVARHPVDQSYP